MPWLPWHKPKEATFDGRELREKVDPSKLKSAQVWNEIATNTKFDMNDYINKPEQKYRTYFIDIRND